MRAVKVVKEWLRPCFGRSKPERADINPTDPSHRFGTNGDRRARCIWLAALAGAVVMFVAVSLAHPQFGEDGRYYLLSSISQVLAAVVALAATLPLLFANLSDYLPFCANRLVASWHFRGFVIMYTGTIFFALANLCFKCAPHWLSVVALAAAASCLCSLLPFFLWIADRTRPKNHFYDVLSMADAIVLRYDKVTDTTVLTEPADEVLEHLELIVQAASVAAKNGASSYLSQALISLLLFWLKYDARDVGWAAYRGGEAWGDFMVTNADSYFAVGTAAECVSKVLVRQCWRGSMRPSAGVFGSIAESLTLERVPQDQERIVAVRGLWRLGVVAQHVEPNGATARAVAHQIAIVRADFTTATFPQVFPMFENHARDWFRMFADIDPTQELDGFRLLVVEEHAALRRRLEEAGS
jgi:hypothetical protein